MEGGGTLPGSTQAGNPPALNLAPLNPFAKVQTVVEKDAETSSPQLFNKWQVGCDLPVVSPEVPIVTVEVWRTIGEQGTWEKIGTMPPDNLTFLEKGAYGATHYFRFKAIDSLGRSGVSDVVTDRTSAACEFADGAAMILYAYGCFDWRSLFIHRSQETQQEYFAGVHKDGRGVLAHRTLASDGEPRVKFLFLDMIPSSVWAADPTAVFVVGESSGKGALALYDGAEMKEVPVAGGIRAPLHSVWGTSRNQIYAVGEGSFALQFNGQIWEPIPGVDHPNLNFTYRRIWGLSPKEIYLLGDEGVFLAFDGFRWNQIPVRTSPDFFDIWGTESHDLYLSSDQGIFHFGGRNLLQMVKGNRQEALWGPDGSHFYGVAEDIVDYKRTFPGMTREPLVDLQKPIFTDVQGLDDQVYVTTREGMILERASDGLWQDIWTGSPFITFSTAKDDDVIGVYVKNISTRPRAEQAEKFRPSLSATLTHIHAAGEKDLYLIEETRGQWRLFHINGVTGSIKLLTPFLLEGMPHKLWGDPSAVFVTTTQGTTYRYTKDSFKRLKPEDVPPAPEAPELKEQKIPGTDLEITSLARINETNQWAIVDRRYLFRYCH